MKYLILALITCLLPGCKESSTQNENPETKPTTTDSEVEPEFGIAGSEKATVKSISKDTTVYTYANYKIVTIAGNPTPGQSIFVYDKTGKQIWKDENKEGDHFFFGISDHYIFVDKGTAPIGRSIIVSDLNGQQPDFRRQYIGDPSISGNTLAFFIQNYEETTPAKAECPEAEEWKKRGLGIAYGRLHEYSLPGGELHVREVFKCFPIQ